MTTFWVQFVQEQFDLLLDSVITVLQQHAYIDDLSLQLEHIIQDEVWDDHEALLAHMYFPVMQKCEHLFHTLVKCVRVPVKQVCQSDYDVCFHPELNVWVH